MSKAVMEYKIGAQIHILVSKKRARNDVSDLLSSSLKLQFELCQLQTTGFQLLNIGLWKGWRKESTGILWLIVYPKTSTCARNFMSRTSFTFFRIRLLRAASRFCAKRRCTCHPFNMEMYLHQRLIFLLLYLMIGYLNQKGESRGTHLVWRTPRCLIIPRTRGYMLFTGCIPRLQ